MIETIIQLVMGTILLIGGVTVGVSLIRMHRAKDPLLPSLFDLITSTDKKGKVRLDARKCFEAGSFLLSTWVIVFLTGAGKLTYEFFTVYLGVWTAARFLRDREQRLCNGTAAMPAPAVKK